MRSLTPWAMVLLALIVPPADRAAEPSGLRLNVALGATARAEGA